MYELLLTSSAETLCHKLALIDGLNEVRPFTTKFPPTFLQVGSGGIRMSGSSLPLQGPKGSIHQYPSTGAIQALALESGESTGT